MNGDVRQQEHGLLLMEVILSGGALFREDRARPVRRRRSRPAKLFPVGPTANWRQKFPRGGT